MKVCVTSYGPTLDSRVQAIFGRCAYFIFVDPESMEFEAEPNPNASSAEDAGPSSVQFLIDKGISTILTDCVGAKAEPALLAAKVRVLPAEGGTVREAVEAFKGRG